jgi:voltage-gated potassium channel
MLPHTDDEPRVAAWNRRADWPLTALALVFLIAYAWSVLRRARRTTSQLPDEAKPWT